MGENASVPAPSEPSGDPTPVQVIAPNMWDYVDPFVSAIGKIEPDDPTKPPGDHPGSMLVNGMAIANMWWRSREAPS